MEDEKLANRPKTTLIGAAQGEAVKLDAAEAKRQRRREMLRAQEEERRFARIEKEGVILSADDIPRVPMMLRIEVVNLCNADCVFCTYQFQTREIETMSFDVFKRAVDQFAALGGDFISFTPLVGESLIDKGLEEKVAYARQFPQFKKIEMWTNAILLTRRRFEALVEAGINHFNISMSGFTATEYKELYRNSNYAKVINNLTEIAKSDSFKKVRFIVNARTGTYAPKEEPDYIALRELGVPIRIQRDMFSWHGQIREEDLPGDMFIINGPKDQSKPCFFLWWGFTVLSNGDMTVCGCTDLDGAGLPLGNIKENSIDAHFKDGRWTKLRDSFMAGAPPEFCKGCDMYWPQEVRASEQHGSKAETAADS